MCQNGKQCVYKNRKKYNFNYFLRQGIANNYACREDQITNSMSEGPVKYCDHCFSEQCICKNICDNLCKNLRDDPCKNRYYDPRKNLRDDPCKNLRNNPCKNLCDDPCKNLCNNPCKNLCNNTCKNLRDDSCKNLCNNPCKKLRDDPCKNPCDDPCKNLCDDSCKKLNDSINKLEKISVFFNKIFYQECQIQILFIDAITSCKYCQIKELIKLHIKDIIEIINLIESNLQNDFFLIKLCSCSRQAICEQCLCSKCNCDNIIKIKILSDKYEYLNFINTIMDNFECCQSLKLINQCICITKNKFNIICKYLKYFKETSICRNINLDNFCDPQ